MRMVLLWHQLPDGTGHFDWMIEPADPSRGLITFRVAARIDHPGTTQFDAERIGDHRRKYLDYEGPLSGERGTVARVAAGHVEMVGGKAAGAKDLVVIGTLGPCSGRWSGVDLGNGRWRFVFHDKGSSVP